MTVPVERVVDALLCRGWKLARSMDALARGKETIAKQSLVAAASRADLDTPKAVADALEAEL